MFINILLVPCVPGFSSDQNLTPLLSLFRGDDWYICHLIYSLSFAPLTFFRCIVGHRFAFASGVLHRDISSGNVLFADLVDCGGFLHDLDYSEVVLMPGYNVEDDLVQQISRRLKDMTVSGIYYLCDGFKQFLTRALINSWRLMC